MADPPRLTHLDESGRAVMVDVGDKAPTQRRAVAEGHVLVSEALARAIRDRAVPKGDPLEVARLAGIQAAKRTAELIPLCHGLPLDVVEVDIALRDEVIEIRAEARTTARTGVEMEALTAVSVAALTLIDMGKAVDREMVVQGVRVIEKSGGRSGNWAAPAKPRGEDT